MIKFFRRIRQRLLRENRFSKYLIYAIGEIVLVVIGILIALQINNWNEASKERQHETKILLELKNGFLQDIKEIESNIVNYKIAVKASDVVLQHLESNKPYRDSLSVYLAQTIGMDLFNSK